VTGDTDEAGTCARRRQGVRVPGKYGAVNPDLCGRNARALPRERIGKSGNLLVPGFWPACRDVDIQFQTGGGHHVNQRVDRE